MPIDQLDKLLEANADLSEVTENMLIQTIKPAIEYRDDVPIIVGKAALIQEKLKGRSMLKEFAKELDMYEKTVSSYKSVEKRLQGLTVPLDISYSARRLIAQTDSPKETLEMIEEHGLSSANIIRILGSKEEKQEREITCPHCHKTIKI